MQKNGYTFVTVYSSKCVSVFLHQTIVPSHSNSNDQNSFHSTIDTPPGVPGVSKNPDDQTEVHPGELEH